MIKAVATVITVMASILVFAYICSCPFSLSNIIAAVCISALATFFISLIDWMHKE